MLERYCKTQKTVSSVYRAVSGGGGGGGGGGANKAQENKTTINNVNVLIYGLLACPDLAVIGHSASIPGILQVFTVKR